ncbi:MAG: hypothetical protein HOD00_03725 [Gemmatimonadales bacterium]|nr:hypothetical protein [Gemmatimonadales bacterium]MBT4436624.1 hypothetical protein [Gemmatimonadales bacterium]
MTGVIFGITDSEIQGRQLRALSARFSVHVVECATDQEAASEELRCAIAMGRLMDAAHASAPATEVTSTLR